MYKLSTKYKYSRFVRQVVVNAAGLFTAMMSLFIVGVSCHGDVIYFTHVLVIDRKSPMRVLTQKSEEAVASSASLLATPLALINSTEDKL